MTILDPYFNQPPSTSFWIQIFCPIDMEWVNLSANTTSLPCNPFCHPVEAEGKMHYLQSSAVWGPTCLRVIDNNGEIFCQTKAALLSNH
mgnify:CR=1 FL=1|jgi:hypothetical protein